MRPPRGSTEATLLGRGLRHAVRAWDRLLRQGMGVFDYTSEPRAFLRLQLTRARHPVQLADGTHVRRGEPVAEIHFHNERLPPLAPAGADLAWGLEFSRGLLVSLRELQVYLAARPELTSVRLVRGRVGFVEQGHLESTRALAARFGLEFVARPAPGRRFWRASFWENLGTWIMVWTYNPASLEQKHFSRLLNAQVLISRAALDERYGRPTAGLLPYRKSGGAAQGVST